MTAPETSLSRWSRLKREAVSKGEAAADQDDRRLVLAGRRIRGLKLHWMRGSSPRNIYR